MSSTFSPSDNSRAQFELGAGDAVRSGIGFGAGVLQVHLAAGVAPHESTKEDKVAGTMRFSTAPHSMTPNSWDPGKALALTRT